MHLQQSCGVKLDPDGDALFISSTHARRAWYVDTTIGTTGNWTEASNIPHPEVIESARYDSPKNKHKENHILNLKYSCAGFLSREGHTKVILAGGSKYYQEPISDKSYIYDILTDTWTSGPNLPQPMHQMHMFTVRGRVLLLG